MIKIIVNFIVNLFKVRRVVSLDNEDYISEPSSSNYVEPFPEVTKPPVAIVESLVNKATVENFCLAIQSREGYMGPCKAYPRGTPAWRNRNPGNCKGLDGNFLVFSSYEIGFAYLENYVRRVMANKHKAYPKDPTIAQYFAVYAPTGDDNDPVSYANEVAKKLGVTSSFLIKNLI